MNLPNLLTCCRFFLIPVYIVIFANGHIKPAFFIVVLAGLTDVLDGYLARTRNQVTQLGIMLDPLADKSMMIVVAISLLYSGLIPWPAALAMFIRDAGMIAGGTLAHLKGYKPMPANMLGKVTTVLLYLAILLIVFELPFAVPFLWGVIGFSFVTTAIYVLQFDIDQKAAQEKEHI